MKTKVLIIASLLMVGACQNTRGNRTGGQSEDMRGRYNANQSGSTSSGTTGSTAGSAGMAATASPTGTHP